MKNQLYRYALAALAAMLVSQPAQANQYLQSTTGRYAKAITSADYLTVAKLSHPSIVRSYGGPEAYADLIDRSYKEAGLRFRKMSFGAVTDTRSYGDITLVTIPYNATISYGGKTEQVNSYYYAFTGPKKKAWFLLDCSNGTDKIMAQLVKGYDGKIRKSGDC